MKSIIRPIAVTVLALLSGVGVATAGDSTAATLQGKVGDELTAGQWRLQVVSVERRGTYESQFLVDPTTTQPTGAADEVIVVRCTITNGGSEPRAPMLSAVHPHHTALVDAHGTSYPLLAFDKEGGHTDEGVTLAPGAATSFVALFSVPKNMKLGELTFSLQTAFDDYPEGGHDVRVMLDK